MFKKPKFYLKKLKNFGIGKLIMICAGLSFLFLGIFVIWVSTMKLPTLDSFGEDKRLSESTKIYDRTGEIVLYDVFKNVKRTVVPFETISPHVKHATIAIEDREFYNHHGVRPMAFLRAIFVNIGEMEFSQGGSTLTQQVIKNSVLSNEKTIPRKVKEWILAIKLEQMLSKDEILNMYLNLIPYGGSIYGVEEASRGFFGKSSADLTIAEAAYIAAIPQAPTYYSPNGSHRDKLEERKNLVLKSMLEMGYITEEEYEAAKAEVVHWVARDDDGIVAPHFVMYIKEYLAEKYGEEAIEQEGFKVTTTIDYDLQVKAEEIVKRYALENVEKFNAENAAAVAIDPKTGQILAMVGSRDYFDEEIDGNFNVAVAPNRQPGSTFKPFAYAAAFNKGYMPETAIFDLETQFSTLCPPDNLTSEENCYSPRNYDNMFRGPMTMRTALAQSINVPAVKTLYLAGIRDTLRLARDMGVQSLKDPNQYGLTLVLGGGEVSLLEMTSAYGVFANEGMRNPAQGIIEIKDQSGEVVEKFEEDETRVLPENTALMISDILSDNEARIPAYGVDSPLHFYNQDVAVKTGTTNDSRDAWIIGYSPNVVVGAWAGNNDNSPMVKQVAGYIVAPLWRELMDEAVKLAPADPFKEPILDYSDLKPVLRGIWQGGRVADSNRRNRVIEFDDNDERDERYEGGVHSILYWVDINDPRGPAPANPYGDPQFERWEYGVRQWAESHGFNNDSFEVPGDDSEEENDFDISFRNPNEDGKYGPYERILVRIDYDDDDAIEKVEYYLNGKFIGSAVDEPFNFSFTPIETGNLQSQNTLEAVATGANGKGEDRVDFTIEEASGEPSEYQIFDFLD